MIKKILITSLFFNLLFIGYVVRREYFRHVELPKYELETKQRTEHVKTSLPPDFYLKWPARLFESTPAIGGSIVFIGDSHTDMFALDEYFPDKKILNRGIGADTVGGVLMRMGELIGKKPKKVFIQIGTNDMGFYRVDMMRAKRNYVELLRQLVGNMGNSNVYVQNLLPTSLDHEYKERTLEFNNFLREECIREKIKLIDLYSRFQKGDSLDHKYDSGDKIHLNGEGYILWSEIIKPYL